MKKNCPNRIIDRTFTTTVYFGDKPSKPEKPHRTYRNPLYIAREYARMLKGKVKSESDLARKLGISRVHVNHFIKVLTLSPDIIKILETLGDPLPSRIVTERMLRPYIGKPKEKQTLLNRLSLTSSDKDYCQD